MSGISLKAFPNSPCSDFLFLSRISVDGDERRRMTSMALSMLSNDGLMIHLNTSAKINSDEESMVTSMSADSDHDSRLQFCRKSGGIAHIAKLLDYQETKRDIWLVMDRGNNWGDDGDGTQVTQGGKHHISAGWW